MWELEILSSNKGELFSGKNETCHTTCHGGAWVERQCRLYLFLT
jgi:hypothetical protein